MILIDDIIVEGVNFKFFEGIDFELVMKHPKDGSDGFYIFFIDNWMSEMSSYARDLKIDSILDDKELMSFDYTDVNNNYISIYQTSGLTKQVYDVIRNKIENKIFPNFAWAVSPCHVSGVSGLKAGI